MYPNKGIHQISTNGGNFNKASLYYHTDYAYLLSSTSANFSLFSQNNLPPATIQICLCEMVSWILKNCEKQMKK